MRGRPRQRSVRQSELLSLIIRARDIEVSIPINGSAVVAVILPGAGPASDRVGKMHAHGSRQLLDDLVRGAIEFAHRVAVHNIERSGLASPDQFVRKGTRWTEDDSRTRPQVLIIIIK